MQFSETPMKKGDETRRSIIRLAAPIFNQRGYAGTSMQDVMQATGLEKGGLYRHFSGKQQLAVEAYGYAVDQALGARMAAADQMLDPVGKLRAMIAAFVHIPSPVAGGCPLMNMGIDADDTNPKLRRLALESLKTWKFWIIRTVEDAKNAGHFRSEARPGFIANQIVAALEGALLISLLEKNKDALLNAAEWLNLTLDSLEQQR